MTDMLLNFSCCCWKSNPCNLSAARYPFGVNLVGPYSTKMIPTRTFGTCRCRLSLKYFAAHNAMKKPKKRGRRQKFETSPPVKPVSEEKVDAMPNVPPLADDDVEDNTEMSSFGKSESQSTILLPSRTAVLQACTITSCLIGGLGIIIRQVSHFAFTEGWPVIDCSSEISLSFEPWHFGLIAGLVVLVSSCRYVLLNTWTDFADSSEAANRQVLSSLEPSDYLVVAFLPGISEELLFRGALLPLFGMNWTSVSAVAALFGILHLGSGRKYSFAIWATLVGVAYGCAAVACSSMVVPMASHVLNNLAGGIMWRYTESFKSGK